MLEGLMIACMNIAGLGILFYKLPGFLKRFIARHPLVTDLSVTVMSWIAVSAVTQTIVGLIASMATGLMAGVALLGLTSYYEAEGGKNGRQKRLSSSA